MNRVTRGTVLLAAVLVAMSCEGDPTGDLRNGADHLVATPSAIFLTSGDSTNIVIEVVDKQGNRLQGKFDLLGFDPGITVVPDTTFNNVYDNKGELVQPSKWTRARYKVIANANTGDLKWRVSGGGVDTSLSVRIVPTVIPVPTISVLNVAALQDTVYATVPAPFIWRPSSSVFFRYKIDSIKTTGDTAYAETKAHVVSIYTSPGDSSTIGFVAPIGIKDPGNTAIGRPAHFVGLGLDYAGSSGYTDSTNSDTQLVMTPALPDSMGGLNGTSFVPGDTVVVTAPTGWRFTPFSTVFGAAPPSVPSVGGAGLVDLGVAPDSLTISFIIGPSANAPVTVTNVQISGAPSLGAYTLTSGATVITSSPVSSVGTLSPTTIALGDTATITAAAGLRFPPTATATFNGVDMAVVGIAADSLSMTVVSPPGATGPVTVNGALLDFLLTVPFSAATGNSLTISGSNFTGHDTPGTVTLGAGPAVGDTLEFFDVSDAVDQYYQLDAPAGSKFDIRLSWPAGPDIDILVYNAAVTGYVCGFGGATGANPENLTCDFSAAVTPTTVHISANVYAGANPAYYRWRLIRTQ